MQNKIFHLISNIFQNSFSIQHQIQISNKMRDTNHLCDLWEHAIAKDFKHDSRSQLGLMLKEWIKFNIELHESTR